jgi:hypothetical protein
VNILNIDEVENDVSVGVSVVVDSFNGLTVAVVDLFTIGGNFEL